MNTEKGGYGFALVGWSKFDNKTKQCSPAGDRLEICFKRSRVIWQIRTRSCAQSKNRFHILSAFYRVFALKVVWCIYFRAKFNLKAGVIENIILNDVILQIEF